MIRLLIATTLWLGSCASTPECTVRLAREVGALAAAVEEFETRLDTAVNVRRGDRDDNPPPTTASRRREDHAPALTSGAGANPAPAPATSSTEESGPAEAPPPPAAMPMAEPRPESETKPESKPEYRVRPAPEPERMTSPRVETSPKTSPKTVPTSTAGPIADLNHAVVVAGQVAGVSKRPGPEHPPVRQVNVGPGHFGIAPSHFRRKDDLVEPRQQFHAVAADGADLRQVDVGADDTRADDPLGPARRGPT